MLWCLNGAFAEAKPLRAAPAGFCKQQLWPLFHYLLPLSPNSSGRFDPDLWQAYVKANKVRARLLAHETTHLLKQVSTLHATGIQSRG